VLAISIVVGLLVAPTAFAGSSVGMATALAVGLVGYVATSVVTGLFYGMGRLGSVATLIIVDATLRAVAVVTAFAFGAPPDVVAFAVAAPFGLAVAIVWRIARARIVGAYTLDVLRLRSHVAHCTRWRLRRRRASWLPGCRCSFGSR
jgi:hypothetical protein